MGKFKRVVETGGKYAKKGAVGTFKIGKTIVIATYDELLTAAFKHEKDVEKYEKRHAKSSLEELRKTVKDESNKTAERQAAYNKYKDLKK